MLAGNVTEAIINMAAQVTVVNTNVFLNLFDAAKEA